jgi:hypothetical protein
VYADASASGCAIVPGPSLQTGWTGHDLKEISDRKIVSVSGIVAVWVCWSQPILSMEQLNVSLSLRSSRDLDPHEVNYPIANSELRLFRIRLGSIR